jgi:hypothetical protein
MHASQLIRQVRTRHSPRRSRRKLERGRSVTSGSLSSGPARIAVGSRLPRPLPPVGRRASGLNRLAHAAGEQLYARPCERARLSALQFHLNALCADVARLSRIGQRLRPQNGDTPHDGPSVLDAYTANTRSLSPEPAADCHDALRNVVIPSLWRGWRGPTSTCAPAIVSSCLRTCPSQCGPGSTTLPLWRR